MSKKMFDAARRLRDVGSTIEALQSNVPGAQRRARVEYCLRDARELVQEMQHEADLERARYLALCEMKDPEFRAEREGGIDEVLLYARNKLTAAPRDKRVIVTLSKLEPEA